LSRGIVTNALLAKGPFCVFFLTSRLRNPSRSFQTWITT